MAYYNEFSRNFVNAAADYHDADYNFACELCLADIHKDFDWPGHGLSKSVKWPPRTLFAFAKTSA
eukprot:scaffold350103_cov19-Prasinocladus_malaysianus.AAC.1